MAECGSCIRGICCRLSQGRVSWNHSDRSLRIFFGRARQICGIRVASKAIQLLADMCGFSRRVGERNGVVECDLRFLGAAKLEQERAPRAVEVEVAAKLVR